MQISKTFITFLNKEQPDILQNVMKLYSNILPNHNKKIKKSNMYKNNILPKLKNLEEEVEKFEEEVEDIISMYDNNKSLSNDNTPSTFHYYSSDEDIPVYNCLNKTKLHQKLNADIPMFDDYINKIPIDNKMLSDDEVSTKNTPDLSPINKTKKIKQTLYQDTPDLSPLADSNPINKTKILKPKLSGNMGVSIFDYINKISNDELSTKDTPDLSSINKTQKQTLYQDTPDSSPINKTKKLTQKLDEDYDDMGVSMLNCKMFNNNKISSNNLSNKEIPELNPIYKTKELFTNKTKELLKEKLKQKLKQKFKNKLLINLTTEGLSSVDIGSNYYENVKQCKLCTKYYKYGMIIKTENEKMCQHCFFMLNYDEEKRLEIDKKYIDQGYCVAMYISECSDNHNFTECKRSNCYLCDYKNKKPIKNILLTESIYPDGLPIETKTEKENIINEIQFDENDNNAIYFREAVSIPNFKVPTHICI
jgi:hypothetical protein